MPPFCAGAADALRSRVDPVSGFQARQMEQSLLKEIPSPRAGGGGPRGRLACSQLTVTRETAFEISTDHGSPFFPRTGRGNIDQ